MAKSFRFPQKDNKVVSVADNKSRFGNLQPSGPIRVASSTYYSSHEGFSGECELPVESERNLLFQTGTFYLDIGYYIV
jgi:hypothetical protein